MTDSLEIVRGLGIEIGEVRASGGGAKSRFWRQLQADIYGAEIVSVEPSEGPSFGAALIAGTGSGLFQDLAAAAGTIRIAERLQPEPAAARRYAEYYQTYRGLYPALQPTYSALHARFSPSESR